MICHYEQICFSNPPFGKLECECACLPLEQTRDTLQGRRKVIKTGGASSNVVGNLPPWLR